MLGHVKLIGEPELVMGWYLCQPIPKKVGSNVLPRR